MTRVLTVRQPWAWCLIHGGKTVENRSWPTSHRGWLWVHAAAAQCPADWLAEIREDYADLAAEVVGRVETYSAIVGAVRVTDCVAIEELEARGQADGWAEGPWCWVIGDERIALHEPIACKGKLGLWAPPPAVLARLPEL